MSLKEKFKNMVLEMYQPKPIVAYLIGSVLDVMSTYIVVKKFTLESETNVIAREILYRLGEEASIIPLYCIAISYIPTIYAISKVLSIDEWKKVYSSLLYGISAGRFYASINNLLLYFDIYYILEALEKILNSLNVHLSTTQILATTVSGLVYFFYITRKNKK
ncbi:MAG: hypothetical protein RQ930_02695 [Candidatus Aenigmarchaeota archaeon]|jgi:hypothetical protein|nr:hypothetical protein [Candidatus Aenigmarchaeota archaeon]